MPAAESPSLLPRSGSYMLMKRFLTLGSMAALSLGAAACGGDDTTGPNGGDSDLSAAEVDEALEALAYLRVFDYTYFAIQPGETPAGLAAQSLSSTTSFELPQPCDSGGTNVMSGTVTSNRTDSTFSFSSDVRHAFADCQIVSPNGTAWTLNGNPNLRHVQKNIAGNFRTGLLTGTAATTGGFRYSLEGRTGTCRVNLRMTVATDEGEFTTTLTGTMCGQIVNRTFGGVG